MTPRLHSTTKNYLYNASLSSSFCGKVSGIPFDQNLVNNSSGKIQHQLGTSLFVIQKSGLLQIQVFAQISYSQVSSGEASLQVKQNGQYLPLSGSSYAFKDEERVVAGVVPLSLQRLLNVQKGDIIEIIGYTSPNVQFTSSQLLADFPSDPAVSIILNLNVDYKSPKIVKILKSLIYLLKG